MAISSTFVTGQVFTAADANLMANSGLVYIKQQTVGSGVTSVTLTDVFSSTYDNYRVTYAGGNMSGNNDISANLGPTSVSGWNTNYWVTLMYVGGNPSGTFALAQSNGDSKCNWVGGGSANGAYASFDIFNPFLSKWTRFINGTYQSGNAVGISQGENQNATSFTAIIVNAGGGTLTGGIVTVYGYRKA
jgi:hypothetical protein